MTKVKDYDTNVLFDIEMLTKSSLIEIIKNVIKKHKLQDHEDEIFEELMRMAISYVANFANEQRKKKRLETIDENKSKEHLKNVLSEKDIKKIPDWIKQDIDKAFIIGKSGRVISVNGKKYHLNNPLNDLSGGEWTYFLRSVINTRYPTNGEEGYAHKIRKIHPSPKPPQLMRDLVRFFTKKNEWVLDYFMGVGGTLLGASLCNRKAIGVDLNKKYIHAYKEASKELQLKEQPTLCGDALKYLDSKKITQITKDEKISLICIDPPYGDMMGRKKTGEAIKKKKSTEATPFTDLSHDLGNVDSKTFLQLLKKSVNLAIKYLKNKRYVIVFTKDFQPDGKNPNLLHADIIHTLNEIDPLRYVGMKIWADESINLYPYGYPYAYVSNQLHQYILVFRKEEQ